MPPTGPTAMRFRTLGYLAGSALTGIRRHKAMSIASATTMAIALLVLGVFLLVSANLDYMATFIESQVEVKAYMGDDTSPQVTETIKARIEEIEHVAEVKVVTKDEALERLKAQFGDQSYLLEAVEEMNPLRDSLEIRVIGPENVREVAQAVVGLPGVVRVDHRQDIMDNLVQIIRATRWAAAAILALLGSATIILISNTVRLTVIARRREVSIMKLVGATDGFIRWPFFLEGMILGLAGALVAIGATWYGYERFVEVVMKSAPFIPVLPRQPLLTNVSLLLAGVGAGVGALGSCWPLRQFLRV